jgi:hypothetical protein
MDQAAILQRTAELISRLPDREVSAGTVIDYRRTLARMLREPVVDPLVPGIAKATYYHRRAAMYWASRSVLVSIRGRFDAAVARNDVESAGLSLARLRRLLSRIEPAVELDPPLEEGAVALNSPASRWEGATGPHPVPGANSKRHVLGDLPPAWDETLWQKALKIWTDPADQADLDGLAVRLLAPVRSEDMMPGQRGRRWSEGVLVKLCSPRRLHITIAPAKSRGGKFGTGITVVKINPMEAGAVASYLAARCGSEVLVVSLRAKDASRKKLLRLGKIALPDCDVNITPYVFRNQVIADFKVTLGAGVAVAAACGHCTDRTQSKYGLVQHGRRRRGLIGVASERVPQTGNVARTAKLRKHAAATQNAMGAPIAGVGMDAATAEPNEVASPSRVLPTETHVGQAAAPCLLLWIPNEGDERSSVGAELRPMRSVVDGNSDSKSLTRAPSGPKQLRSETYSVWDDFEFPEPPRAKAVEEEMRKGRSADLWQDYVTRTFDGLRWNPASTLRANPAPTNPRQRGPS